MMMNPPPKNKRGKRRNNRDRDHRQDELHSQKRGRTESLVRLYQITWRYVHMLL